MRLVLSGGGTGGHIIPNVALIHEIRERFPEDPPELLYFGTYHGMERKLMDQLNVPYRAIVCGKLRRYFSFWNIIDFFKIPIGIVQAFFQLLWFRPSAIFCKGGFVCFPVAVAGRLLNIPVILHESDVTPGLANRLSAKFATTLCVSFPESKKYFPNKKVVVTGNPVRRELAFGTKEEGLSFTDFTTEKPVILFMGGSLGAEFINQMVFKNFDKLLPHYQVVHICGDGKVEEPEDLLKKLSAPNQKYLSRYRAFNFVGRELKDLYAAADIIISRAGAISLAELDFFNKPVILIPLSKKASRGDQIDNASVYAKTHLCEVMHESEYSDAKLINALKNLLEKADKGVGYASSQASGDKVKSGAGVGGVQWKSGAGDGGAQGQASLQQNKFMALEKIVQLLMNT